MEKIYSDIYDIDIDINCFLRQEFSIISRKSNYASSTVKVCNLMCCTKLCEEFWSKKQNNWETCSRNESE